MFGYEACDDGNEDNGDGPKRLHHGCTATGGRDDLEEGVEGYERATTT